MLQSDASNAANGPQSAIEQEPQDPPASKPLLTVGQQIAHLKSKGMTFCLCTEGEAAEYLRTKCQFFRIYAYRRSFPKRVGGRLDGQYANLDFGQLRLLSQIDRMLRDALLPMTLDVEHYAKVRLLAAAEDAGEDGHAVMRDYFASVSKRQRDYLKAEFFRRKASPYSGDLVRRYGDDMPIWVFLEVMSFGAFLGLLKYCAERWNSKGLLKLHYQLRLSKEVRNGSAHGACFLNDLSERKDTGLRAPTDVVIDIVRCGIPKRLRVKWLRSPRMMQICTLICLYNRTVPDGTAKSERTSYLKKLFRITEEKRHQLPAECPATNAVSFIERLTRGIGLLD